MQIVDGNSNTIPSSLASHTTDCPFTAALYVYNDATFTYVAAASHPDAALFSIDPATGIVTAVVDTGDALGNGAIVPVS